MPTENKVLVLQKGVEEVTAGGIIKPDTTVHAEGYAQMEGTIIAQSIAAFNYIHDHEWQGEMPQPGDRIIIAKYAGVRVKGADGVEYVLVNDKDVTAVRTA